MYSSSPNNLYCQGYEEAVFAKIIAEHAPTLSLSRGLFWAAIGVAYSMLVIRSVPVAFQKFCFLRFLIALMILIGSACCL